MKNKKFFFEMLLKWNRTQNKREMPWKGEKNPYKIWISEIILQQTRVQQGLAYYNRFIRAWPDITSLAAASEQEVYKLWEGLGYYSRCRNLIASAKYINDTLGGQFPEKYEDILLLKGIGSYTAAAIVSFAFNQPYAVLDGNVFRVLARFFGIRIPVDSLEGKKIFKNLAQDLVDKKNPATYNQAIMDFGAVICKPMQPLCHECPLQKNCLAFQKDQVATLPIKEKSIKKRERFFNYIIVEHNKRIYVQQRGEKDIWQNLYEFILLEAKSILPAEEFLQETKFTSLFKGHNYKVTKISKSFSQKLTHQTITGRFFHVTIKTAGIPLHKYRLVSTKELAMLPFPKFITAYLKD
ncbi:MAG: A/G-specific adenine glycosylase [Ginsengibacter sp.]